MESKPKFRPNPSLKLMDQVREVLRYYHYAYRTETSYCQWILRYIRFFGGKTHPNKLDAAHVERFLSNLTTQGKVSPPICWKMASISGSFRLCWAMPT